MNVHTPPPSNAIADMYDRRVAEAERRGRPIPCALEVRGTSYAEGQTRWRFSVDDVRRMVDAGILAEDDRVELWGGELVVMAAKNIRHEVVKNAMAERFIKAVNDDWRVAVEAPLQMDDSSILVPDLMLFPRALGYAELSPANVTLVIEISDSSLRKDLGLKAGLYSAYGVRELWVIDVRSLVTRIHREPSPTGYRDIYERRERDPLLPLFIPDLSIELTDLD